MSTTTIVSSSATILQESGRMVLTILSSNTAAGVLAEKTQQALDAIDSAADTAMFTAGMYPDTATGLINTVDGEYFSIPSPEADEFSILYQNVSGSAVEKKRFGTAAMSQAAINAAAVAEAAADFAFDTVQGIADVAIYNTKAEANAAASGLADQSLVMVLVDESLAGIKSLYRKESGSLVFKQELLTKDVVDAAVVDAEAAKTAAESARDAAQLSAGVYVDTVAGLAGTTNGQYFSVPSADTDEYLILYKNNAGSAVEQKRYLSAQYFDDRFASGAPIDAVFSIADSDGLAALAVKEDGTVVTASHETDTQTVNTQTVGTSTVNTTVISGNEVTDTDYIGFVHVIEDGSGKAAFGVTDEGVVVAAEASVTELSVEKLNGMPFTPSSPVSRYGGVFSAQINYINNYGQSLGEGSQVSGVTDGINLTLTQEYDNIGFVGRANSPTVTYPLTVANTQVGTRGESPVYGTLGHIKELILEENGLSYALNDYQLLGCTNGYSGYPIDSLKKGTGAYSHVMSQVTAGKAIATAAGKTFMFAATTWTQGEQDLAMSKADYKSKLKQLAVDLNTDGKAITGQQQNTVLICYQTATVNRNVGLAQLEASEESGLIFMACPMYQFHYYDSLHINAASAKWLGGYYGLVYKRVVIDRQDWQPLKPVQHAVIGSVIDLYFNKEGLVLDTTSLPAQSNYGFEVLDGGGAPVTISSVVVMATNRVRITCATAPSAGWTVRYGFGTATGRSDAFIGGSGNLRDSQGDTIVYSAISKPMHNWCVIFSYSI